MKLVGLMLSLCTSVSVMAAPALLLEGVRKTENTKKPGEFASERLIMFYDSTNLRSDSYDVKNIKTITISRPDRWYICKSEGKDKGKCSEMLKSKNANESEEKPQDVDAIARLDNYGDTFRVKYWKVNKLKKVGKFAGYSCQYFRRQYLVEINIMEMQASVKNDELFCVEQKILNNPYSAQQIKRKKSKLGEKMQQIIAEEKKAFGTVLFSKAKVNQKNEIKSQGNKETTSLLEKIMDETSRSMAESLDFEVETVSIFEATNAKVTTSQASWFKPPWPVENSNSKKTKK